MKATTREEAIEAIDGLLERMQNVVDSGGNPHWSTDWHILRNDILEFAERTFGKKSRDHGILHRALYPGSYSIYGSRWQNFLNDYGEAVPRELMVVRHRLEKGQTVLPQEAPDEHLIEPGTPHSAYVLLRDIVESASRLVFLVDPYVDRTLFSLLSNVPTSVEVRILTHQQNVPADFIAEAGKYTQQTGAQLECRVGLSDFHDRFLLVDDKLFFSGASFKDLGRKGSVVAEVSDIKAKTLTELETRWNSASPLK